jgi:hypothetical protein
MAAVALARKLSGVLWAMLRDGTLYDSALEAQESARGVREQARRTASRARVLEVAAKKLRRSAPPADAKAARPPAKRDELHGGQEPHNTQSMLRRAERYSSAYPTEHPNWKR